VRLVFLGPPGAGKGTQAKAVAVACGVPHVSSGDIFRGESDRDTPLGRQIRSFLESGNLVPDDVTTRVVASRLAEDDCREGWVLDGFPRTEGQAEALDEVLEASETKLDAVIYLNLNVEVIVERMDGRRVCPKCGRSYHVEHIPPPAGGRCESCGAALVQRDDDEPETVRQRLATYECRTAPLMDYYERRGLLIRVSGEGTSDEVGARIFEQLKTVGDVRRG